MKRITTGVLDLSADGEIVFIPYDPPKEEDVELDYCFECGQFKHIANKGEQ